jgi:hypothetical protein
MCYDSWKESYLIGVGDLYNKDGCYFFLPVEGRLEGFDTFLLLDLDMLYLYLYLAIKTLGILSLYFCFSLRIPPF